MIIMAAAYKGAATVRQLRRSHNDMRRKRVSMVEPIASLPSDIGVMTGSVWDTIPGGASLIEWFGRVPRFHDAEVLDISIAAKTPSFVKIHAWVMTDEVGDCGYFVLDRHAIVTVSLEEVTYIALTDFDLPGIIFDLEVSSIEDRFQVAWSGSYGVAGILRAKRISIAFEPGKPESL